MMRWRHVPAFDDEIRAFYERYPEAERLATDFRLEAARTRELIERFLPPAPATVLDVGSGPGGCAVWLAERREILMRTLRRLESEPSLLGGSPHLMAVAGA
jgi:ubiquinone/menaquinone biosynthesis C-methylase UbiE